MWQRRKQKYKSESTSIFFWKNTQEMTKPIWQWTETNLFVGNQMRTIKKEGKKGRKGKQHWLSSEELHAQKGKDNYEEEEQEEQADDGLHWVEQRNNEVTQRRPVPDKNREKVCVFWVQCNVNYIVKRNHKKYNTGDSLGDFKDPQ